MKINNITLARICNDLENFQDYKLIENKAYYKDEIIGTISAEEKDGILDIHFKPYKPLDIIEIKNFKISKSE